MKSLVLAALTILTTTAAHATDLKVNCVVTQSNDKVLETTIKPVVNDYTKIGDIDGFSFRMRNNDGSRVSLEIFDIDGEGRYYADATLVKAGDSVANSIWRRDLLLEVNCTIPQ